MAITPIAVDSPLNYRAYGSMDLNYGPYATIAAANAAIPNNLVDAPGGGFVSFRKDKVVKIGNDADGYIEYWWISPYGDANLQPINKSLSDLVAAMKVITDLFKTDSSGDLKFVDDTVDGNIGLILTKLGLLKGLTFEAFTVNALNTFNLGGYTFSATESDAICVHDNTPDKNVICRVRNDGTAVFYNLKVVGTLDAPGFSSIRYPNTKWKGKTFVAFGDSLLAAEGQSPYNISGGYITRATAMLGATVVNKGISGSAMRSNSADGTHAWNWTQWIKCFTHSSAFKEDIITNWSTYRTTLTGSPPVTLSADDMVTIRTSSYEVMLLPYLNGTLTPPDLFIFELGVNDWFFKQADVSPYTFDKLPATRNDKNTYIGGTNFIFDLIKQYKPLIPIAIIGAYENQLRPELAAAQQFLATYWEIPICKMWELTAWSQQKVPGTLALWDTLPWSTYKAAAGSLASSDMTMQRYICPDGLHPDTRPDNFGNFLIADIVANWLSNLS